MTKSHIRNGSIRFLESHVRREITTRAMEELMALLSLGWILRTCVKWYSYFSRLIFCVSKLCLASQENRFNVLPRVCRTDFTQIPMAAFVLEEPFLTFTVFLTCLIQWQNFLLSFLSDSRIFYYLPIKTLSHIYQKENGYQPFNAH